MDRLESDAICPATLGSPPWRIGALTPQQQVYRHCCEKEKRGKAFWRTSSGDTILAYAICQHITIEPVALPIAKLWRRDPGDLQHGGQSEQPPSN